MAYERTTTVRSRLLPGETIVHTVARQAQASDSDDTEARFIGFFGPMLLFVVSAKERPRESQVAATSLEVAMTRRIA